MFTAAANLRRFPLIDKKIIIGVLPNHLLKDKKCEIKVAPHTFW